jgi:hypothetical protein
MKYPSIKAVLISVFLNIIFISMIFAQESLTSLKIQGGIDRIWTTGQLDIGHANVASKHVLPRLYKRNDFQLMRSVVVY